MSKTIKDFPIGSKVLVYLDENFSLSHTVPSIPSTIVNGVLACGKAPVTVPATILLRLDGMSSYDVLLGWDANDSFMPNGTTKLDKNVIAIARRHYIIKEEHKGWEDYLFVLSCHSDTCCLPDPNAKLVVVASDTEGHFCDGCNQQYPYAIHNLSKGPFVCSGCKMLRNAWK